MLGLALWMIGDQVFDSLQSYTYFMYSEFWNSKWHQQDEANLTEAIGTNDIQSCNETALAQCWDHIHITMVNHSGGEIFNTSCGPWNKTTKTITLNCKLRLSGAYFACSLACWLLPPMVFGSLLTYMNHEGVVSVT